MVSLYKGWVRVKAVCRWWWERKKDSVCWKFSAKIKGKLRRSSRESKINNPWEVALCMNRLVTYATVQKPTICLWSDIINEYLTVITPTLGQTHVFKYTVFNAFFWSCFGLLMQQGCVLRRETKNFWHVFKANLKHYHLLGFRLAPSPGVFLSTGKGKKISF